MGSHVLAAVGALYLLLVSSAHAQKLKLTKCEGTLPRGRYGLARLYDNDDTVYLFGGQEGSSMDDALKYSISKDTIEIAGYLPYRDYGGGAVMDKFRNIFYLAGVAGGGDILQYLPESRNFLNVSSFAVPNDYFATIAPDIDTALLFGGKLTRRSIMSLNLTTLESKKIAELPKLALYPATIWVEDKDTAYVFDAYSKTVQKYSLASNRTELLSARVPIADQQLCSAVWDGRFGYLMSSRISSGNPAQSLIQFDPETETFGFIPVEGYEPSNFSAAPTVYIEKLNRIYTFGGHNKADNTYRKDIYYIDLDPLTIPPSTTQPPSTTTEESPISTIDPDIFSCFGRPFSNYPYPEDCTKFVICREDHGYLFECPEPLHFDPLDRHCTFPEKARCEYKAG